MAKQSCSTGKTSKSRKVENLGKGKVTPVQIAFIVDRYLSDNNYAQTRSTFRCEASNLISRSPVQEAPKSLLSLSAMLDEYIRLKEQKVFLDQERCRLEQEKFRVHNLLRGMQDVMNAFNASAHVVTPPPPPPPRQLPAPNVASAVPKSGISVPTVELPIGSPAGYSVKTTPAVISTSEPLYLTSISSPITSHKDSKRKGSKDVAGAPPITKRTRRSSTTKELPLKDTSICSKLCNGEDNQEIPQKHTAAKLISHANASGESAVEGYNAVQNSHVVKCLFNQAAQSPPTNSSGPETPPLASSSQADKSASPLEIGSTVNSVKDVPQKFTSTNCTIISSETIQVSPAKQIAYYSINQHISTSSPLKTNLTRPSKRDHVKGRLNFDAHETQTTTSEEPYCNEISPSESVKEADILDLDLAHFDALGDINFSELLVDFDLDGGEGISYSCQQGIGSSPDSTSWSPGKSGSVNIGANQFMSQVSSTVTEILSDKDMNLSGSDSVKTLRAVTKCIKILSPVKSQRSLLDQEILPAED